MRWSLQQRALGQRRRERWKGRPQFQSQSEKEKEEDQDDEDDMTSVCVVVVVVVVVGGGGGCGGGDGGDGGGGGGGCGRWWWWWWWWLWWSRWVRIDLLALTKWPTGRKPWRPVVSQVLRPKLTLLLEDLHFGVLQIHDEVLEAGAFASVDGTVMVITSEKRHWRDRRQKKLESKKNTSTSSASS